MKENTFLMLAIILLCLTSGLRGTDEAAVYSVGTVKTLDSKVYGKPQRYFLQLPAGYADGQAAYPVLFIWIYSHETKTNK